jgi:hypothetical protein
MDGVMMHSSYGEAWKHFMGYILNFKWNQVTCILGYVETWIQSIRVIRYSLLLLADDFHGLQLVTGDMYKAEVHVFIHGHTRS